MRPEAFCSRILTDSVKHHLISDVPVGMFLSAGLDSATLTGLASKEMADVKAITLGFKEYRNTHADEVPLASAIAKHYGCAQEVAHISRKDFDEDLAALLHAMDQPTIDGVNTWFVARAAKQAGLKVAISGLGGDELFGGYPSFRQIPILTPIIQAFSAFPGLGKTLRLVLAPIIKQRISPKYASLFEYGGSYAGSYLLRRGLFMPWELPNFLDHELVREGWGTLQPILRLDEWTARVKSPHAKITALEMSCYMRNMLLRDADWAGMAHSLEIRVPLVDIRLFCAIVTHLTNTHPLTKRDLTNTLQSQLPDEIMKRPKSGFSIPVQHWIEDQIPKNLPRGLRGWSLYVFKQKMKIHKQS